jgi:thiol-disulfide isomerase/thioredoxin
MFAWSCLKRARWSGAALSHRSFQLQANIFLLLGALGVLTVALLSVSGCNDDKKPAGATAERAQAVTAAPAATHPARAPTHPAPATSVSAAPRANKARRLCAGELDQPGREFPKKSLSRARAPGAGEPSAKLPPSSGWTWVNFWAAWCVPCKEEMPRLLEWEKKLRAAGKSFTVAFISLDDDRRQLDEFLQAQPPSGVRASYWLTEGKERESWLAAAEIENDPELPTHLLVDPRGKIRCRVRGAVEDSDYASLLEIVGR